MADRNLSQVKKCQVLEKFLSLTGFVREITFSKTFLQKIDEVIGVQMAKLRILSSFLPFIFKLVSSF